MIATYTFANLHEIETKLAEKTGCIPVGISVIKWLSFLLRDGVRPFRHASIPERIDRLFFDQGKADTGYAKKYTHAYYCVSDGVAHSSLLSQIALECDEQENGLVFRRISRMYDLILLDEVQDLAGYDYQFVEGIYKAGGTIEAVGDPRQRIYSTNHESKNSPYKSFFEYAASKIAGAEIDDTSLNVCHRCPPTSTEIANSLYPGMTGMTPRNDLTSVGDGFYLIGEADVEAFYMRGATTVLRYNKRTKVPEYCSPINMGDAKGLTLEDVLIYPTAGMCRWIVDHEQKLADGTRSKLYVALTRAKHRTAVVMPTKMISKCPNYPVWQEAQ